MLVILIMMFIFFKCNILEQNQGYSNTKKENKCKIIMFIFNVA